jgi:hypothetical protein
MISLPAYWRAHYGRRRPLAPLTSPASLFFIFFSLCASLQGQEAANWAVSTLAGQAGTAASDDGNGGNARFNLLRGVAVDASGQIFVADTSNHTIRKVSPGGAVTTLAGSAGTSGSADGTGTSAQFNAPAGVAVDSSGNVYVADMLNHTIRKITSGGVVTTIAGSAGNAGAADGTGGNARFKEPVGIAVDGAGVLYVADSGNSTIRKISGGTVSTLAGAAGETGRSDGTGAQARFDTPYGIAVDLSGTIYVADTFNHVIRKVTSGGGVSTWAGQTGVSGYADGSGGRFSGPASLSVDLLGTVYVAESANHTIRSISSDGTVNTLGGAAGQDGSGDGAGTNARFNTPAGIAVSSSGTLYVGDSNNSTLRKMIRVQVTTPPPSDNSNNSDTKIVNISTRSFVGTGGNIQIAGFVIRGSQPKQVLIRASGPALEPLGVSGVLADPTLTLYGSGSNELGSNDDWGSDVDRIAAAASRVGAFGWTRGSKDAAMLITLPPGSYTAHVKGKNEGTGTALIEVYEADETATDSKLINISTRSEVRTGNDLQIAGFVIRGSTPKRVLIRASGPALIDFGATGPLADPTLSLYSDQGALMAQNDDWGADEATIETAAAQAGAFGWKRGSKDAAVVTTLQPGNYTAHVKGKNSDTGMALIEVYELQ